LFFPRSYAMPSGVPRDRVRAVQEAFLKTLKDSELVTEAEKTRMTLNLGPPCTK
jgi:tripartite-type tricarboxylate transporter receptor subunit TctC